VQTSTYVLGNYCSTQYTLIVTIVPTHPFNYRLVSLSRVRRSYNYACFEFCQITFAQMRNESEDDYCARIDEYFWFTGKLFKP